MKKTVLLIAGATSLFSLTAAFASGLTSTGGTTNTVSVYGSIDVTTTQCHDTFAVSYTELETSTGTTITEVKLDDGASPTPACLGKLVTVKLNGGTPYTGTTDSTTGDVTVAITTPLNVSATNLTNTAILIAE